MTAKNPSDTWFYNDWENDPALKACSLAAQGLWMRLLCIAARSPERGVVQIGSLNFSFPGGLAHIASAVGRPLEEIAPLIDELVSSGAASLDRKKRITNRRMVRTFALSAKRSEAGKNGAAVRYGKERENPDCHSKSGSKPMPSSSLQSPRSPTHGETMTAAVRASASPDGPPRPRLPDSAKWAERLDGYSPWLPIGDPKRGKWQPTWGPQPDSAGRNPLIPVELLKAWHARRAVETSPASVLSEWRSEAMQ